MCSFAWSAQSTHWGGKMARSRVDGVSGSLPATAASSKDSVPGYTGCWAFCLGCCNRRGQLTRDPETENATATTLLGHNPAASCK